MPVTPLFLHITQLALITPIISRLERITTQHTKPPIDNDTGASFSR